MATESPWRVLAERLGEDTGTGAILYNSRRGKHEWFDCAGRFDDERFQNMLIGQTMRVAWAWAIQHGKTREYIMAVDMVTQSNPKFLGEHCLKLLDAVGYQGEVK